MMKLRAFLKSADPKETLFIGSGSSFLCIGERRIVKKDMPKISVEKKASFKDALDYETKKLEWLYDELRKDPDMAFPEEKISFIEKRIYNLRDILKDYKDMMEREVIESYPRMKGDGTVVIIEGCEQGSYWLKSEYDRRKRDGVHKGD